MEPMGHGQSAGKLVSQYGGLLRVVAAAICVSLLAACGGLNGGGAATHSIGVKVAGLTGACPNNLEQWTSGLVGYSENLPGPVRPAVSITSPNCPQNRYFGMTIDSSGYIYVASDTYFGSNSMPAVLVFAPGANGMATPVRTLVVPGEVGAIAVDSAANVYVASGNSVLEFAAGASGNAAPIRTLNVAQTCVDLAVDGAGNIVCVPYDQNGNPGVTRFAVAASGFAAPTFEALSPPTATGYLSDAIVARFAVN
jgi:hypothetical protein